MSVVNILLTDSKANDFEDFVLDDATFCFSQMNPDGLFRVVDGPIWVFVDWFLDELSGLELCRRLRADPKTADAHITMVLEDSEITSRKRAIEAGADDYMMGPVDRQRILDRVLASTPGFSGQHTLDRLEYGPLVISVQGYRAYWRDRVIEVTPNEFRLLRLLAENANKTLSRREIVENLGKDEENIHERTVDVWIGRLRKAIRKAGGGNPLRTVRFIGYVLDL